MQPFKKGPQIITRRRVETAVLVTIEEWDRLEKTAGPGLKALLLARVESLIPEKRNLRRRAGLDHVQLSERDSRRVLDLLEKPPAPNAKLLASARMLPKRSRP